MMELGPVFRALLYNKTRFWLITLEVALTLAIVVNCVTMIKDFRGRFTLATGLDENNIVTITTEPFGDDFKQEEFINTVREADLAALQSLPGVMSATVISYFPLSGSGSMAKLKPEGSDLDPVVVPDYQVTENALQALGVELVAGREFLSSDFAVAEDSFGTGDNSDNSDNSEEKSGDNQNSDRLQQTITNVTNTNVTNTNVIVTRELADLMFPDGDALGRTITDDEGTAAFQIVGIIRQMTCSWPSSEYRERVMLVPGKPGGDRYLRYLVRTEPGALDNLYNTVEQTVRGVNAERIFTIRTMTELKRRAFTEFIIIMRILSTVVVLLILVTSLGIIGLTSFSVSQRTRQIGTRRALGATRAAIARYFVLESWMVTGIGLVLGAGLAYGLNVALVNIADAPKIDISLLLFGSLALWLIGILAALAPALRATTVAPEVATRAA